MDATKPIGKRMAEKCIIQEFNRLMDTKSRISDLACRLTLSGDPRAKLVSDASSLLILAMDKLNRASNGRSFCTGCGASLEQYGIGEPPAVTCTACGRDQRPTVRRKGE